MFMYRVFIDCEWRQKSPLQQDLFALYIYRGCSSSAIHYCKLALYSYKKFDNSVILVLFSFVETTGHCSLLSCVITDGNL